MTNDKNGENLSLSDGKMLFEWPMTEPRALELNAEVNLLAEK